MRFVIPGLLLLLATGCLGSGGSTVGGTSSYQFVFSVSPPSLSIPSGGGGYAMVAVVRGPGFNQAVALSLEGAPEGVVGSGTVAPDAQAGQLSLRIAPEVAPQDLKDLRVKGTAGNWSRTVAFHLAIAAPLPAGAIDPDQVQACGGAQSGGALENSGSAQEPVMGTVSRTAGAGEEIRHGFHPSIP